MVVSGAILQLSAIGAQNAYINSTDYTLFKSGVRAFTNFAAGQILVSSQGATSGFYGNELLFKIPRSGDLLHKMYFSCLISGLALDSTLPGFVANSGVQWSDDVGRSLVEYAQVDIGGTKFDKILSEHLMIRFEQLDPAGKEDYFVTGTSTQIGGALSQEDWSKSTHRLFVELPFWFDRFAEQSLPIIALMFHDVDIRVKLRNRVDVVQLTPSNNLTWTRAANAGAAPNPVPITHPEYIPDGLGNATAGTGLTFPVNYAVAANVSEPTAINPASGLISDPVLVCTYVYLDQLERKLFAGSGHEYVIKQHQYLGSDVKNTGVTNVSQIKNFSHPVVEFSIVMRRQNATGTDYNKNWRDFTGLPIDTRYGSGAAAGYGGGGVQKYFGSVAGANDHPMDDWQLQLNNHARLVERSGWGMDYYRYVVPREVHSKIPNIDVINFSFALRPENVLATGTLNCSRIDNIEFRYTFSSFMTQLTTFIFAENFNVVKISSGLAGLRFSS
jgi:hypothetical protein